jgi:hypothetical protein
LDDFPQTNATTICIHLNQLLAKHNEDFQISYTIHHVDDNNAIIQTWHGLSKEPKTIETNTNSYCIETLKRMHIANQETGKISKPMFVLFFLSPLVFIFGPIFVVYVLLEWCGVLDERRDNTATGASSHTHFRSFCRI